MLHSLHLHALGISPIQDWLRNSPPIDQAGSSPPAPPVSFVELWQRVAGGAMEELASGLAPEVAADVHSDLTDDLVTRLSAVGEAAVWEQFNARRSPRDVVMAHLRSDANGGAPDRAIYCRLLEEMRSDGLDSLTASYPVLRRHLSTTVRHWLEASREILTRVRDDRDLLAKAFELPPDARLAGIQQGLSDPHRGGRTVAKLTFTSDSSRDRRTVVYKPKDLRLDRAFQQLLSKVPPPTPADGVLRNVTVLARDGYGYMDWVPHVLCKGERELRSFYRNAGRLAAVLYLLGCTDCHSENFIADRDQLVLVDGETLFQGTPRERNTDRRQSTARSDLHDRIANSVLRLGLLPQWYYVGQTRARHDVSALGIQPPAHPSREEMGWIELNTDGMISGHVERQVQPPTSSPVGIGSSNRLSDFADDFCDGFQGQLVAIAAEKRRWLDADGHLAQFRAYRSRFVRRPTWLYVWMLGQQSEPGSLSSEADQERVRARLAGDRTPFRTQRSDPRLIAAEAAQLDELDVPYFEQPIDGAELIAPDGTTIPDALEVSGYENARRKLEGLDAAAIDLQLTLIRGVISAKDMRAHRAARADRAAAGGPEAELSLEDRRIEATAIGELLVDAAVGDDTGAVEWLGIDAAEDLERSSYGPLGISLYSGRTGIALFLAALAHAGCGRTDDYTRIAIGACSDLRRLLDGSGFADDGPDWWRDQPLGLAGGGGVLLALVHMRELLPALAPHVDEVTSFLLDGLNADLLRSDERLDVVFGCAGLIGPLLAIGTPTARSLALAAGDTLVERQHESGGWLTKSSEAAALTGFSHGASGMAAALSRVHAVDRRRDYVEAAAKALSYERRHFDPGARNWPDLRDPEPGKPRFMLSWCHGAPGIALARLCLARTPLWGAEVEEDLSHALESTADYTMAEDSLCCGRFGRAAILRMAATHEGDRRWLSAAARLEARCLAGKQAAGSYSFSDVPGLFQGIAGAGLALLDGARVEPGPLLPSILSAGLYAPASGSFAGVKVGRERDRRWKALR